MTNHPNRSKREAWQDFRLTGNTRFAFPIIDPVTKQEVSAEALYNSASDACGCALTSNIRDLILDNLIYPAQERDDDDRALCTAVYV
jgi:hypothetical protein